MFKEKSSLRECLACGECLPLDHTGIRCNQDHHLCADCSDQWINTLQADQFEIYPPKCCHCNVDINLHVFEMNITDPNQRNLFLLKTITQSCILHENERWVECPFCSYREIYVTENDPLYFDCIKCEKRSCYTCLLEITEDYYSSDEEDDIDGIKYHLNCAKVGPLKKLVEKAIEDGSVQVCPTCKLRGQKDENCTHIQCVNCQTMWCYVCGKSESEVEKGDGENIFGHNENWDIDTKRCPMYLHQIYEVDESWPEGEDIDSLAHFHRLKSLKLLSQLYRDHKDDMELLIKVFPQCLGGFSLEDIKNTDPDMPMYEIFE